MSRYRFGLMILLSVFFIPHASLAQAPCDPGQEVCIGKPCISKGATVMDKDRQNIIACLPRGNLTAGSKDQRPLYWKQSSIDGIDCGEGRTLRGISSNGAPVCVSLSNTPAGFTMFAMETRGFGASGLGSCENIPPPPPFQEEFIPFPPPPFPPFPDDASYKCVLVNAVTQECSCPSGTHARGLGWFAAPPGLYPADVCIIPYLCEPDQQK